MEDRSRTVRPLTIGNVMQAMGLQIFAPILPVYLASRGMSSSLIGVVMAAGIAGYGLGHYPSGYIVDRLNRRLVLLGGMFIYSIAFFLYLLPMNDTLVVCVRFSHAALASVYSIAAVAVLIDLTEPQSRGRMFGLWHASSRAGFLIGPMFGGLIGSFSLPAVFVFAGSSCFAAGLVMTRVPRAGRDGKTSVLPIPRTRLPRSAVRRTLPLLAVGAAGDYVSGAFMAIWSLWLLRHDASALIIGTSFCLFALPAVVLSTWFGSYADKHGPRRPLFFGCAGLVVVGPTCVMAEGTLALCAVALLLGFFSSISRPLVSSQASALAEPEYQGRIQSLLSGGLMSVQLVAATLSGVLLGIAPPLAFGAISVVAIFSAFAVWLVSGAGGLMTGSLPTRP